MTTLRRTLSRSVRFLPMWIILGLVMVILIPNTLRVTFGAFSGVVNHIGSGQSLVGLNPSTYSGVGGEIAPLFTPQVQFWRANLQRWATTYNLDPNLLATVMQIESCGHDKISSSAGAQGLFQVMPFHFASGEVYTDVETNARRGGSYLRECMDRSNDDPGMAMACYNGGPSVLSRNFASWHSETQRYYRWGTTIYEDARQFKTDSPALQSWLDAGGIGLCRRASDALGIGLGIN